MHKSRLLAAAMMSVVVVAGTVFAVGNLLPMSDSTETLGTTTKKWGTGFIDNFTLESDDTIKNETDDEFTFESNDTNTTINIKGYEGSKAVLLLDADEGDDNDDSWFLESRPDNILYWIQHTTTEMTLNASGNLDVVGGFTVTPTAALVQAIDINQSTAIATNFFLTDLSDSGFAQADGVTVSNSTVNAPLAVRINVNGTNYYMPAFLAADVAGSF